MGTSLLTQPHMWLWPGGGQKQYGDWKMRKSLLLVTASFVALSFAAPAMAADLRAPAPAYTKAPAAMPVALYDWSGFYVGLNGGGGWSHDCRTRFSGTTQCQDASGGTFGGQIGYRWQAANWVFGLEGQGNWADISGRGYQVPNSTGGRTFGSKIESFGLITGQVGYAWNNVLLYVKGGAAVVDSKFDFRYSSGDLYAAGSDTRWGGTIGAGLEFGLAQNWTLGVEYNHIFLSGRGVDMNYVGGGFDTYPVKQDIDMALVRLNYKFGGPVVAKY